MASHVVHRGHTCLNWSDIFVTAFQFSVFTAYKSSSVT